MDVRKWSVIQRLWETNETTEMLNSTGVEDMDLDTDKTMPSYKKHGNIHIKGFHLYGLLSSVVLVVGCSCRRLLLLLVALPVGYKGKRVALTTQCMNFGSCCSEV